MNWIELVRNQQAVAIRYRLEEIAKIYAAKWRCCRSSASQSTTLGSE
jgi:hypothetical protein